VARTLRSALRISTKFSRDVKKTHLVLNWEKCHFMGREGIDIVSERGIEVDRTKIEVI
jgi:hypothetical protein